jgi:hypothetical protein
VQTCTLQIKMVQVSINRRSKIKGTRTSFQRFVLAAVLLWSVFLVLFDPFNDNVLIIVDDGPNLRKSGSALLNTTDQTSPREHKNVEAIETRWEKSSGAGGSVPKGDYHFPNTQSNENRPDDLKVRVMLFITTHMSAQHFWLLKSCWPPALQNSPLLNSADVVVYLNADEKKRKESMAVLKHTFMDQDLTIHIRDNQGYNQGAMAALSDATKEGWFSGYDWVIRVNPDVIIRDSTFMLDVMQNDPNATGLLINCVKSERSPIIHTDFFAIKPEVLPKGTFLNPVKPNAERAFTHDIREAILNKGGQRYVPGSNPLNEFCRAGHLRKIEEAHVVHYHPSEELMSELTCPIPFQRKN